MNKPHPFDYDTLDSKLGRPGRMISGSKTVPSGRTGHTIYWNACVFAKIGKDFKQVWYGDIDLTESEGLLKVMAKGLDTHLCVTQENPFRWDGYTEGLKNRTKPVYEFQPDGGVTIYA